MALKSSVFMRSPLPSVAWDMGVPLVTLSFSFELQLEDASEFERVYL